MEVDYRVKNRLKTKILSIVGQIDTLQEPIREGLDSFRKQLTDANGQVQQDMQAIQAGLDRMQALLDRLYQLDIIDHEPNHEALKEIRHDLRAAIGAVMGYGELVEDELSDLPNNTALKKEIAFIRERAEEILPLVDSLTLEERLRFFEEGEEHLQNYCAVYLPGRILIIDDDPLKLDLLSRRIRNAGHTVLAATDGPSGLALLETEQVDLILLDMIMPGMDGYEVLLRIKERQEWREIPIVVISSLSDLPNVVRCIRAGADDYLPMPVNSILLHARINSCMYRKISRDREQAAMREVAETRHRLEAAIDSIDEGFVIYDREDHIIDCNDRFRAMYPVPLKDDEGNPLTYEMFLRRAVRQGLFLQERRHKKSEFTLSATDEAQEDWIQLQLSYHKRPQHPTLFLLSTGQWIEVIENKIASDGIVAIHKDISEGKKKEERLNYLATHDALTNLANRTLFEKSLEDAIKKGPSHRFAVAFFDLDGFKKVNDTLGHDFGDFLLLSVSEKLKSSVRSEDLIARLGGDEFAAILYEIDSIDTVKQIIERCLSSIGTQVERDGHVASFGVSIGVALYPEHGQSAKDLLTRSDEAMYEVKRSGKGSYKIA